MSHKCWAFLSVVLVLVLAAGAALAQEQPPTPPDDGARSLPAEKGEFFVSSGNCAICHTQIFDEAGNDVSVDSAWRATMMANAARDPYWTATVRSESLVHPAVQSVIEDKCTTCHMPMARTTVAAHGGTGALLDDGFLNPDNELHVLAMDGVACALCHQITRNNLGEEASYSGGYAVDITLPLGRRPAFGPYQMDPAQAQIMAAASGYVPVFSAHVERSELCATCHTLYTPYLNDAGEVVGVFPEQTPYLEWLYSDYANLKACQDCHMPRAEGGALLSPNTPGGELRYPIFQHFFGGTNVFMLGILDKYGDELNVTATEEQFGTKILNTMDMLQSQTATVAVETVGIVENVLTADVSIESLTGHKVPSGFPSRRMWIRLAVTDGAGRVVFESGAYRPDGYIIGNDNDAAAGLYEPHYQLIGSPDQVQIYETIMRDVNGDVTSVLLRGAGYLKDNRLLPRGFNHAATADIAVIGRAIEDANFMAGGGDKVTYRVDLGDAKGPFTVKVDLLFQTIGYRWAVNLGRHSADEAPEVADFLRYYTETPNLPVVVASASVVVEP
ncbi:MAG: hypothetical protein JXB47_20920 [Anaerolineae bacterium]|nr:hypothetical protein [Anaerolineae bacterium]